MVSDYGNVDRGGVPMFDKVDPRSWRQNFVIFLMRKERAHIGFQSMPVLAVMTVNNSVCCIGGKNILVYCSIAAKYLIVL